MSGIKTLPPFEQSLASVALMTKEAILAPMRVKLREYNITEPQWRVMRVINDRGATDATGLAEVGLLHAPSVTRILRELEERKLIARETDAHDRRRSLVTLSPEGCEVVAAISRHVLHMMQEYGRRFGEERLETLVAEMRALSAAIKGVE